ncbi:MAG: hypothetical protein QF613_03010 [Candidatus Marinimicrobia bacterium]|jgi:hypothetical protein|nr:hypothetical protein [Candidatus Neomarinimicrobiota bacterium]MDP6593164.1 hypothetical protein [Candidatus Neomarinimicrobiota bacterium]MDP6836031.1 hypothetical protein [Candidatus Neomarinimicrobiota bacterium]MDP6967249.1 hypothetical protein [Candidatus Neomarinimicrobiota bacterium]|tara:strand:+ start:4237 stop:4647 length:411 start_codon:yes stop_codon:yes gene_type:complete
MSKRKHLTLVTLASICCLLWPASLTASQPEQSNGKASLNAAQQDSVSEADARQHRLRVVSGISLAVAVAANLAGQDFIQQSDSQYERYLNAGNPADMNRYFNRSTALDKNAGYSFVLFEAALTTSIFTFFFSLAQP